MSTASPKKAACGAPVGASTSQPTNGVLPNHVQPLCAKTLTPRQTEVLEALGREKIRAMYRTMVLIRVFEQRAEQMYQQRKIAGFLHLYMGQEAVGVGVLNALDESDYVAASYRDHGLALALGISPKTCMAELFGKATGLVGGKGGSMHYFSKEKNLLGGHGIVGGQVPIGVGAAFAAKYNNTSQVSLVMLGDGAVSQGAFHEAANLASIWDLPCIFLIENNHYGMGTSIERASSVTDFTLKGPGYNMEALKVDGMNMLDCYATAASAVESIHKNPHPILIEASTYRYRGHSISDPAKYRSKEEVAQYRSIDPIPQIKTLLIELGWFSAAQAKQIDKEVQKEVLDAITFAEESPEPALSERTTHVYA